MERVFVSFVSTRITREQILTVRQRDRFRHGWLVGRVARACKNLAHAQHCGLVPKERFGVFPLFTAEAHSPMEDYTPAFALFDRDKVTSPPNFVVNAPMFFF